MMQRITPVILIAVFSTGASAEDRTQQVRDAVQKVIPLLQKGAAGSSKHNKCFTCHNHGLPILALTEAQANGLSIDADNLQAQVDHTKQFLDRGKKRYDEGKGQGGGILTAGYALWALSVAQTDSDEFTDAVARYVLNNQKGKDHWTKGGRRPPSDGNEFTTTFVVLRALNTFLPKDDHDFRAKRFAKTLAWAKDAVAKNTEDCVFRLKSLKLLNAPAETIRPAVDQLLKQQRDDGGWAQTADMKSDAYATGTVLATLLTDGSLSRDHAAIKSGVDYLLQTQLEDGTWHVVTRADGFQPYYESGFPHGEDQFISMAASSWAAIALLRSLPE